MLPCFARARVARGARTRSAHAERARKRARTHTVLALKRARMHPQLVLGEVEPLLLTASEYDFW